MPHHQYIDDGKRHTWLSKALEFWKGETPKPSREEFELDYDTIEPIEWNDDTELLAALQVKFPKERRISSENMKSVLTMFTSVTYTLSYEIIGTRTEIIMQFVCRRPDVSTVRTYLTTFIPKCTILERDTYNEGIFRDDLSTYVTDFGLREEFVRPLPTSKGFHLDSLTAFFGVLEQLGEDEQAGIQILFKATCNTWADSIIHGVSLSDGSSFFGDVPEAPKLAMEKNSSPLFAVAIRTFAQAPTLEESGALLDAITYPILHITKGSYNALIPLPTPEYDASTRITDIRFRESHRLGMLLNLEELMHLVHFPSESIYSKKLFASSRKTKETPFIAQGKRYTLGINPHNNLSDAVTISIDERLKHTHIIGATGTGKSNLIANLILQDIKQGRGLALIDPHGDLVHDVMARVPENRLKDVVLVDPSDIDYPIGLNILQAHNDREKELLSSDLVASFRKLSTSWGDQMNAVFSNAILAMLESSEGGTLHDVRRFLVEKEYREKFLKQVRDPSVLYYWLKEFPIIKSGAVGPILTRLDTFLRPRTIRNMLVQKTGLDFEKLLNGNKIVLIKLSQGLIGTENSYLLGSLVLSKLHQAAFARQNNPHRNPFFIYIDEFQNIVTPSIKEMLSGVRKYNVGLVLSHQDLQQLHRDDGKLINSVLSNCYTRIAFRVGEPDAKKLENNFASFDGADLQNLGRGEAVVRIEQPQYDCSLDTIALSVVEADVKEAQIDNIVAHSRTAYASTRKDIEAQLLASLTTELEQQEKFKQRQAREEKPQPAKREQPAPTATLPQPPPGETQVPRPVEQITQPEVVIVPPVEVPVQTFSQQNNTPEIVIAPPEEAPAQPSSTHKYFQALVKRMAEARGYTATIEAQIPTGGGSVDVLLTKEGKTIAVEVCITTDAEWELHNITKCLNAGYDMIVSLSGDLKQLEKIKKKCSTSISNFETKDIRFYTPDVFFQYLDTELSTETTPTSTESTMKGYRVQVTYDAITQEEMKQKRSSVTKVIANSMKRQKKK